MPLLTIRTRDITGAAETAAPVYLNIANEWPKSVGQPLKTLLNNRIVIETDDAGEATVNIEASAGWEYQVQIFLNGQVFSKRFYMPAADSYLADLDDSDGILYWAVKDTNDFVERDFIDSARSNSLSVGEDIVLPAYTGNKYSAVAYPLTRDLPDFIGQTDKGFNSLSLFVESDDIPVNGMLHRLYISKAPIYDKASATEWTVK